MLAKDTKMQVNDTVKKDTSKGKKAQSVPALIHAVYLSVVSTFQDVPVVVQLVCHR